MPALVLLKPQSLVCDHLLALQNMIDLHFTLSLSTSTAAAAASSEVKQSSLMHHEFERHRIPLAAQAEY